MNPQDSNTFLTAAILTLAIMVCFREQIGRIEDKHLLVTLVGAMVSFFVASITTAVVNRIDFPRDQFILVLNITVFSGVLTILMFALLLYHTAYRALMLIFPHKLHIKWLIAAVVSIIELTLNLDDYGLFEVIFRADITHYTTTSTQKATSITLIAYVCILDSLFFAGTQARIIAVMGQMGDVRVSVWHYLEGAVRCMFYSGGVLLYFLSTSGLAFPPQEGLYYQTASRHFCRFFRKKVVNTLTSMNATRTPFTRRTRPAN
ncbi:hypothetical protein DFJ73DRAFT_885196 [Zopfochytrium polystomum]|nr:hypothetical protein DFJ73DRAFT_885196 [Zopfochytrium polystomum]